AGKGSIHQHGSSGSEVAGDLSAKFPGNAVNHSFNALAPGQFLNSIANIGLLYLAITWKTMEVCGNLLALRKRPSTNYLQRVSGLAKPPRVINQDHLAAVLVTALLGKHGFLISHRWLICTVRVRFLSFDDLTDTGRCTLSTRARYDCIVYFR